MIILKSQLLTTGAEDLAKFVNINKIKREDILAIVPVDGPYLYSIFYYGDSATEEITRGLFGWSS